jgi:hypothetical protein
VIQVHVSNISSILLYVEYPEQGRNILDAGIIMAEIVGSAVVHESVSQILSGLLQKYEDKQNLNVFRNLERLEMAHIRLEAVLQTSDKWDITDTSLLRWRRKLKCAAQECQDTLHRSRQRILDNEHIEKEVSNFCLPKRVLHATRSFVTSIFNHNSNDLNRSIVQRFEWYADGASEFLSLLELGGMPRCHMPFDPLIRHLLAGKILKHRIIRANKCPLFLLLAPFISEEHGIEGRFYFMQKDHNAPDDDFCLTVSLQISESTDIVGIAIQCLQLFSPLFKSMVEKVREELMQLPTQDFLWVPYYVDPHQQKFWDNVHRFGSQWFRPNPFCCKEHDKHNLCLGSQLDKSSGLPFVSLDPVIEVGLRCQVSLSECNKQRASLSEYKTSAHDHQCLKAGVLFAPHGTSEDMLLADKFPAIAAIYSEEQHFLHTVFTLGQIEEIMLPKAIDYFCQHEEATVYQMIWRSRHGTAYIRFERASLCIPSTRQTFYGAKRRKLLQGQDEELELSMKYWVCHFLDLWAAHAPIQLQASIMDWYQGVKEIKKQHTTAT